MRRIEVDVLDGKSIMAAIKTLNDYKKELNAKMQVFSEKLADLAKNKASQILSGSGSGDSPRNASVDIKTDLIGDDTIRVSVIANGEGILFWEFGAGIYYNNGNAHPKAGEFGMGVGTYPGQTHAITPGYWWYKGEDGLLHFSRGTQATMPMYNAYVEMIQHIGSIAAGVFSKNG